MTIKILNLYAGIGGNRKLWGGDIMVTAIELDPQIAQIYKDFFPQDEVIVTDAHQYLLEHFKEFDFIWSSPPCPTHSSLRKNLSIHAGAKPVYPDMRLYQEFLLLMGYFKGKYVIENVISWYEPLIKPQIVGRHYFWTNFVLNNKTINTGKFSPTRKTNRKGKAGVHMESDVEQVKRLSKEFGFDLTEDESSNGTKRLLLRNCVNPELGLHIFEMAFTKPQRTLI